MATRITRNGDEVIISFAGRLDTGTSAEVGAEINNALKMLNERERNVIEAFYGINQPELTLEEIGSKYNLTRERVRQIKEKAIRRLRTCTKNKVLKTFLG
jgi:RNA polymerase primary sigma factor